MTHINILHTALLLLLLLFCYCAAILRCYCSATALLCYCIALLLHCSTTACRTDLLHRMPASHAATPFAFLSLTPSLSPAFSSSIIYLLLFLASTMYH